MENLIIILIVGAIIGLIVFYLVRRKKKGSKCIGCPYCDKCGGNCAENGNK